MENYIIWKINFYKLFLLIFVMEYSYNICVTTNEEKADMFRFHLVLDLQPFYDKLLDNPNWLGIVGGYSTLDGSGEDFLYKPKSGFVKVSHGKSLTESLMRFSAVEESTLKEMMNDLGFGEIEQKSICKGLKRIYSD